jgi:hypothetical protein
VKLYDYIAAHQCHANMPEINQVPIEVREGLVELAGYLLNRQGYIRLGTFCAALQRESKKAKYGSVLYPCWPYFKRLSPQGMWSLYERILFYLERDHGPLVCTDRGSDGRATWGFADPVCDNCGAHATKPAGSILCRSLAQIQDHPDWRFRKTGKMPNTVWKKSHTQTSRAA